MRRSKVEWIVEVAKGKVLKSHAPHQGLPASLQQSRGQKANPIREAGWKKVEEHQAASGHAVRGLWLLQVYGKLSLVPKLGSDLMNMAVGINSTALGKAL